MEFLIQPIGLEQKLENNELIRETTGKIVQIGKNRTL